MWLTHLRHSFALQLAAMLLAMGLLPLLWYFIASNRAIEEAILNMAATQHKAMLRNQRDYMRLQTEQIEALAANLGQVEEIAKSLQAIDSDKATTSYDHLATQARIGYLLSNYRNMKGLVSIDLFSLSGKHYRVGDSLTAVDQRSGLRDQLLAATTKSSASVVWHGVQDNVQRHSNTQKVVVATKLVMRDNASWLMAEPVGMLLISYSTDVLHAHLSQVDLGEGAQLLVIDDQKRLIYHPDKAYIGEQVAPDFAQLLAAQSGSIIQTLGQRNVLLSYERMPGLDWIIVSIVPTSTLMAAMAQISQVGYVLLLVSIVLIGLFVYFFMKRVVQPIGDISDSFQQFQEGKLAQGWRMRLPTALPQIKELVSWFNAFLEGADKRREADVRQRIAATAFESQEGMFVTDDQHRILQVNGAFTSMTGYTANEVVGQTPHVLASGRHDASFYAGMRDTLNDVGSWRGEIWNRRKDGAVFPEWLTITAVKDEAGHITHFVATLTDITQRKATEEEIRRLAFFDPLTGLPNRRLLIDRLEQALLACTRTKQHGALMFLDLDKFKTLNDTLGHAMGDMLLRQVSERLTQSVRECDTVARLGGDEFVVLLENLSTDRMAAATEVEAVGNKILRALDTPHDLVGNTYRSTSSMGIALFQDQSQPIDELMKHADMAMYQAKEAGRNTLRFYDPHMQTSVMALAQSEAELRQGIEEEQFVLHYQPQVDAELRITGAEVLLRWQHPVRGLVSPAEFISLAEETGLILPLGDWVLAATCQQLVQWASDPTREHLVLSVNVSARQFSQPGFAQSVLGVLQRTGARATRLKLELTESLLVNDVADVVAKMSHLKAHGIGFSLDDFGTGYSSLSYLKQLPLCQLKIDQSFVRDVLTDPNDASIARMVIALGRSMGLEVIAEGVETQAQQDFLRLESCHAFQGYLFGRPMPSNAFEQLLEP
ncbi:MAG: EAL domain-containing protein [Burkholderiales bacterium]|nr:EAL domain-containing protein [Burkholderiales bacterium]